MDFDAFKNEWLGRRIDYDHVYGYQCVDLILEYIHECYGISSGVWGNAIDYWDKPSEALLTKFQKTMDGNVHQGDIAIFNGLAGNPYGHIGIATGEQTTTQVEILEQNGADGNGSGVGGDAIRTRFIDRSRLAGLLRPITIAAVPPPPPTVPYTVQVISTKQVRINKDTHRWNVTYDNFTAMANNPVEAIPAGNIYSVSALVHNSAVNYNYYLQDTGNFGGFNTLDCDDYTPPPPTPIVVTDVSKTQGALPITKAEKYDLVTSVVSYNSAADAQNDQNGVTALPEGSYYIYSRDLGMLNLTKDNMKAGVWINPKQNVLTPVPQAVQPAPQLAPTIAPMTTVVAPDWRTTNTALRLDRKPVNYLPNFEHDIEISELNTGHSFKLSALDEHGQLRVLPIVSTFWKNGIEYARTWKVAQDAEWWGIPMSALEEESLYDTTKTLADRVYTRTTKVGDMMPLVIARVERFINDIKTRKK